MSQIGGLDIIASNTISILRELRVIAFLCFLSLLSTQILLISSFLASSFLYLPDGRRFIPAGRILVSPVRFAEWL